MPVSSEELPYVICSRIVAKPCVLKISTWTLIAIKKPSMCEQLLSLVKPTLQKGICTATIKSCLNAICIITYQNVMNIFSKEKESWSWKQQTKQTVATRSVKALWSTLTEVESWSKSAQPQDNHYSFPILCLKTLWLKNTNCSEES